MLTTTVVLLQNNLRSFDKSQGAHRESSLNGTLNRQTLSKSPGLGGTIEVKQIGNTTSSNTFMNNNNNNGLQGSSIGGGCGGSFMKKTFVEPVNQKIDTINEMQNESNLDPMDRKPSLIIVNKNEHFRVSKKIGKEMSAESKKVRKSKIVSSS